MCASKVFFAAQLLLLVMMKRKGERRNTHALPVPFHRHPASDAWR